MTATFWILMAAVAGGMIGFAILDVIARLLPPQRVLRDRKPPEWRVVLTFSDSSAEITTAKEWNDLLLYDRHTHMANLL